MCQPPATGWKQSRLVRKVLLTSQGFASGDKRRVGLVPSSLALFSVGTGQAPLSTEFSAGEGGSSPQIRPAAQEWPSVKNEIITSPESTAGCFRFQAVTMQASQPSFIGSCPVQSEKSSAKIKASQQVFLRPRRKTHEVAAREPQASPP